MAVTENNNTQANVENKLEPPVIPPPSTQKEFGGPKGPEPTRYGDWEKNGRCIDF